MRREDLEERARLQAEVLVEHLVEGSESVDHRQGTYLLAALAAELGAHIQRRSWELATGGDPTWEIVGSEAETVINAAWRCMASVWAQSELEDRRVRERQERLERETLERQAREERSRRASERRPEP